MDKREVAFVCAPHFKLLAESPVRGVVLCTHDRARGELVESMDNAWSRKLFADLRQLASRNVFEPPRKRIHKRARFVASCRMNNESRGLVDNDDGVVFVNHIERNVFRRNRSRRRRRKRRDDAVPFAKFGRTLGHAPVHRDGLFIDQPLDLRAREERHPVDHVAVEALLKILEQLKLHRDRRLIVLGRVFLVDRKQCIAVYSATRAEECGGAFDAFVG